MLVRSVEVLESSVVVTQFENGARRRVTMGTASAAAVYALMTCRRYCASLSELHQFARA